MAAPKLPCFDYQAATKGRKKDFPIPIEFRRAAWDYMRRKYIDTGFLDKNSVSGDSFEDMINQMHRETGAPARFWEEIIVGPKGDRIRSADMLRKEDARRTAQMKAQLAIEKTEWGPFLKAARITATVPRAVLTAFHAGVYPVTHAGGLLLTPTRYQQFVKGWATSWGTMPLLKPFGGGRAFYERARLELASDPEYAFWRNAGLRIGLEDRPVGIMSDLLSGWLGKTGGWNDGSWLGLMRMRLDLAKQAGRRLLTKDDFKSLADPTTTTAQRRAAGVSGFADLANPEARNMAQGIAEVMNHATGVTTAGSRQMWGGAGKFFFAPELMASKFARAIPDPLKTARTFWKLQTGQTVSAGERAAAYLRMRNATEYLGTWLGGLMLNDALLQHFGSDQRINFFHMTRPGDWLRFKSGDGDIFESRGPEEYLRLLGQLVAIGFTERRGLTGRNPWDQAIIDMGTFLTYKLAPGYGLTGELFMGTDIFGRPLPENIQNIRAAIGMPRRQASIAHPQYTMAEYAASRGPIFIGAGARDMYDDLRARGADEPTAQSVVKAGLVTLGAFLGGGVHREREQIELPTKRGMKKYKGQVSQ